MTASFRQLLGGLAAAAVLVSAGTRSAGASVITDTPGLVYTMDAANGVTAVGGAVSAWADQSGNGRNFLQAVVTKQPTLVGGAGVGNINGQPVIRFDGDLTGNTAGVAPNADELALPASTSVQTVILVNRTLQHRNLDGIWGDDSGDNGIRRTSAAAWQHPGNTNDFSNTGSMFVNGVATNAAPLNQAVILVATRAAATTFNDTSIGDYFQVGTNTPRSWNGDLAEIAVFDRALTATERQAIEQYLGAKYNIGVPEPGAATLLVAAAAAMLRRRRAR